MSNDGRTVFQPTPLAGAMPAASPRPDALAGAPAGVRPAMPTDDVPPIGTATHARNRLMPIAARLLIMAAAVQAERRIDQPQALLDTATAEAKAFEKELNQLGLSTEDNARARYAVLATLDDIVQNLPGGATSDWARQSLVVRSFGQAFGGDQFWVILNDMLQRPAAYGDLLELYQACLAVGFQGRFRVLPDAQAQLGAKMNQTFDALRGIAARPETDLVPHWHGVPTPLRTVSWRSRFTVVVAVTLALLLLVFLGLKLWLDNRDEAALAALRDLPPQAQARIDRVGGLQPTESTKLARIRSRLKSPCIRADEDGAHIRLVVSACPGLPSAMFEAGAATLAAPYRGLVVEAGQALASEKGGIVVAAHTDSDQIRGALALTYPDNAALSSARADDVVAELRSVIDPARLTAVGRGASEPVDRGSSPEAKARNRRVELVIPWGE